MDVIQFKETLFEKGKQLGFSDMEIFYLNNKKFNAKVYQGEVDNFTLSEDGGVSFRGLYNGKMGYSYTEKIDDTSLELLLQEAKENTSVIDSEEDEMIFKGSSLYQKANLFSEELESVTAEEKIDFLKALEAEVFKQDNRVKSINSCMLQSGQQEKLIANTKGLLKQEKSNMASLFLSVIVQEGNDIKSSSRLKISTDFKEFDAQILAKEAVEEAVSFLGAESVDSKDYPVLLKNTAAASLIQAFTGIFSADNVQKGKSLLGHKRGQTIANDIVVLVDDPFLKDGVASRSFDSEGVASKKVNIIEKGVLNTFFHNLKTAAIDKEEPTGHGYKPSYKGTVSIAPSNLFIQPGTDTYEDLVSSTKEGLVITDLQGLHSGTNAVSGDFSIAAHGYYVKDGKINRPVNQITIAGNFYDVLKDIEAIGNDLEFGRPGSGYVGSPTLKVKSLAVAGK